MVKLFVTCFTILFVFAFVNTTPLDDYVFAPDSNYGYELIKTYKETGYTLYILNFTSQKWYDGKYKV